MYLAFLALNSKEFALPLLEVLLRTMKTCICALVTIFAKLVIGPR